jgi:hypothetical protein
LRSRAGASSCVFWDSKGEVGFNHFEVRGFGSIRRHLTVGMVSHLFLAAEAAVGLSRDAVGERTGDTQFDDPW